MIDIDCSNGEGGGQIIRTGLTLSCILKKPVKFTNIRAKRPKPGLQAQHLTCVQALQEITSAKVTGAALGSSEFIFEPNDIKHGSYTFDIGTAGSCTLLAQCVLPVLLFASQKSDFTIKGGTHVPFAPPFPHMRESLCYILRLMGVDLQVHLQKPGFYPTGQGKIRVEVRRVTSLKPIKLTSLGSLKDIQGNVLICNLPENVGKKEEARLRKITPEVKVEKLPAASPGNCVWVTATYANVVNTFSSLGEKEKPAEKVAITAIHSFEDFEQTGAVVEEHLADQILLYCALASGNCEYTTSKLSSHLETNAFTIKQFLPNIRIGFEKKETFTLVRVEGQ